MLERAIFRVGVVDARLQAENVVLGRRESIVAAEESIGEGGGISKESFLGCLHTLVGHVELLLDGAGARLAVDAVDEPCVEVVHIRQEAAGDIGQPIVDLVLDVLLEISHHFEGNRLVVAAKVSADDGGLLHVRGQLLSASISRLWVVVHVRGQLLPATISRLLGEACGG